MSRVQLGEYELLFELASGGMATLYVARQTIANVERLVAIKRVHRHVLAMPGIQTMFRDEARIAASIRHPNVVRVLDVVSADDELLIVLDYVESVSLSALSAAAGSVGERLPIAVVVRVMSDALAGLHAAHEATDMRGQPLEIVHRDFSPQNVLVGVDGVSQLIDFGVAKAAARITSTESGLLKGKFQYMSPEQARGTELDRRSDVFSAGVVLFEALTGSLPFGADASDPSAILLRIVLDPVPSVSSLAPEVPALLGHVVESALERARGERFQTANALREALVAAVPPATPAEVAACVTRWCNATIAQRRDRLQRALVGTDPTIAGHAVVREALAPTTPAVPADRLVHERDRDRASEPAATTASTSARSRSWLVLATIAGIVALVGAGLFASLARHPADGEPRARLDAPSAGSSVATAGVVDAAPAVNDDARAIVDRDDAAAVHPGETSQGSDTRRVATVPGVPPGHPTHPRVAAAAVPTVPPSTAVARVTSDSIVPSAAQLEHLGLTPEGELVLRGQRVVASLHVVSNKTAIPDADFARAFALRRWRVLSNYRLATRALSESTPLPTGSVTVTYRLAYGAFAQPKEVSSTIDDPRVPSYVEQGVFYAYQLAKQAHSSDDATGTVVLAVTIAIGPAS